MNRIQIRRIVETATGYKGVIVSDDYGSDFDFFETSDDDITLISETFSRPMGEFLSDLAEHIVSNKVGISVDGSYYDYEEFCGIGRF